MTIYSSENGKQLLCNRYQSHKSYGEKRKPNRKECILYDSM